MAAPVAARRFSLGHALEIDVGIVVLGLSAMFVSFFTGQEAARWQTIVLAPIAFLLAVGCEWLVYNELRALWRTDPGTPHRAGAAVGAAVAGLIGFFTIPVIIIMPVVWIGGVFNWG